MWIAAVWGWEFTPSRAFAVRNPPLPLRPPLPTDVLALAQLSTFLQAPVHLPGAAAGKPRAMLQLLGSFQQAERRGLSDLADLYYNRAALHTYCQSFAEALRDYRRAAEMDRTLPVAAQVGFSTDNVLHVRM